MRAMVTLAMLLMAGCATEAPPPPAPAVAVAPCPDPVAAAIPAPPTKSAAATPAVTATRAYHGVEATESGAVTKSSATASYIREIRTADRLARDAVRLLVSQDGHPTDKAIATAKSRLDDLVTALEATPQ
jgi:hypothetical protein